MSNSDSGEEEDHGPSFLKIGAAVAGTALLALGAWNLASSSSSSSSSSDWRDDRKEKRVAVPETARSTTRSGRGGGRNPYLQKRGNANLSLTKSTFKMMSYNVWFREDLEVYRRMEGIGSLIQQHAPDVVCFQEVTPKIYRLFRSSNWWKEYKCSLPHETAAKTPYFCMQMSKLPIKSFSSKPFMNSVMGRELCLADIKFRDGKNLLIATSHLESPCPAPPRWDQMYSKQRVAQANESLNHLQGSPNVIFAGDMNWDDKLDGPFPLPEGWIDAWMELKPRENGWTYDTKANRMLSANRTLQKRLDRFICNLQDFKIESIQMIGMEAIPGLSYCKEKRGVRGQLQNLVLPVLPSDHFGLLLTISSL